MKPLPLNPRAARCEIEIDVPVDRAWRALTEPRELEGWFPVRAEVEPGEGGALRFHWPNAWSHEMRVLEWEPGRHLSLRHGGYDADPALTTTLDLRGIGERSHVRVVTSGFPSDAEWDGMIESTRHAYRFLLIQLRHYLQNWAGSRREEVGLRFVVPAHCAELWQGLVREDPLGVKRMRILDRTDPYHIVALSADSCGVARLSVSPVRGQPDHQEIAYVSSAWKAGAGWAREASTRFTQAVERLSSRGAFEGGGNGTASGPPRGLVAHGVDESRK